MRYDLCQRKSKGSGVGMTPLTILRALLALPSRRRRLRARLADQVEKLPYRGGQDEIVIIPLGFGLCSGQTGRV